MKKFNEFIIEYKISLQEKRKAKRVPGASNEKPTGSVSKGTYKSSPEGQKRYKAAKVDIEVKQGLRDAGASGDFSPTMSPEARKKAQAIRDARMKRLATPDPFDDDYAKKTGKVDKRTKIGKKIGSAFETPKKSDLKKLDKKPGGYRAPKGDFGPGITKGQANVREIERSSFKKTQPSDIKKTAGYKPFAKLSKDIQDYKDRNVPGGPRKTGRTSFSGSPSGSRFDPEIGMASDDSAARRQKKVEDALNKAKKEQSKQKGYSFKNKPTPGSEPIKFEPSNRSRESSTYRKKLKITGDYDERSAYKNLKTRIDKGATKFGKEVDTAAGRAQFDARKLKRMSKFRYKGLGGKARPALPKIAKSIGKAAAKNPKAAAAIAVGTLATAAIARGMAMRKNTLGKGDFTKTAPIQDRSGQNVRFKYDKDSENLAKPYLTTKSRTIKTPKGPKTIPGSLTKFKTGDYKVPGINVNQNMKQSAFEKQIKNLNKGKGTGFFGGTTKQDKKFLKSVKNASRPT